MFPISPPRAPGFLLSRLDRISETGHGFGWSVLQPDWSMILNVNIQYNYVGIIIILVERECIDKFIISF